MTILAAQVGGSYKRDDGLWVFSREEFASRRFEYKPGQHAVFGGPTTRGKTKEAFSLLEYTATPELPALVAVSKPTDTVTMQEGSRLGYRRVSEWPPIKKISEIGNPPSGYLIWPKFGDVDADVANAARVTSDLIKHTYANGVKKKQAILVMDDTMVKAKVLNLDGEMVTILTMAGAMGIGIWVFVQKPTDSGRTTVWSYEQATHLLLTKGGDAAVLKRYMEISGDNAPIVRRALPSLLPFQFLYQHRYEDWICVIDSQ